MLVRVAPAKVIWVVRVRVSSQRHDQEYFGVAFCSRENKSSSMRRLTFNSCSLLANIKCDAVCLFFLRITAFFHMARKINIDFGRRICRLALAASAMFIYVSLKLLTILTAFTGNILATAKKNGVWINRRNFVKLGRSKFEFSLAHEKKLGEIRRCSFTFTV